MVSLYLHLHGITRESRVLALARRNDKARWHIRRLKVILKNRSTHLFPKIGIVAKKIFDFLSSCFSMINS